MTQWEAPNFSDRAKVAAEKSDWSALNVLENWTNHLPRLASPFDTLSTGSLQAG